MKKNFVFSLILSVIFGFTAVILCAFSKQKIAFYDVPEKVQNAVVKIAKEERFLPVFLDSSKPLSEQKRRLNQCSAIIYTKSAPTDKTLKPFSKKLSPALLSGMPVSIQNAVSNNDKLFQIPILYDFYQIDLHIPSYKSVKISDVSTYLDLQILAKKEQELFKQDSMYANLQTPADFLDFIGILCELTDSWESYEKMLNDFSATISDTSDADSITQLLDKYLTSKTPLETAVSELNELLKLGLLSKQSLIFTKSEMNFYESNELSAINFTKLSEHRMIKKEALQNYESIYIPSVEFTPERKFAAEQISFTCLKRPKKCLHLIERLSNAQQNELATQTGLCPVQKDCQVPDQQASDVRYWLASSKGPVLPFSRAFTLEQQIIAANHLKDKVTFK